ncbi:CDP-diacylglycerol--glycerol-3-phosphate 3-phosphatidyltransferase [Sanguibacter suaedae]|uniref:CDP-diacylglycerol--glycerol-3-phosphate 3-phosphatidyltransferase n=1 Tax=Sanguibacter suaedae TaxID=2795737 RepID=A0A934M7K4_9MICO|nr:CDP-diacylglycerol--glycerol-3-phosphate 3-phosphatidyltransferase [Sanguibacter suaedae]MBI9115512.1 CDP-diacylglycerol--glycerol-3-phosphate 3-phosphatidyltransferase [Sanguibacter suaedae]
MTSSQGSVWNAPNIITMARIAIVPVFAWALLAEDGESVTWRLAALAVFGVAAASDRLDGYLARKNDLVTDLGKILDPIADKVLIGTALVLLSVLGDLWWWVTVTILFRELAITAMRFLVLRYAVMPASRGGKLKTVLQSVGIAVMLLPLDHLPDVVTWLAAAIMGAALVVTVVTGVDYAAQGWRVRVAGRASTVPTER